MTKKLLLVAAVAMIDAQNRVLMAQRPEGKEFAGYWEFPGGKVEVGETPEFALTRELFEELGVIVNPKLLKPLAFSSHNYQNFHILMPLWGLWEWQNQPQPLEGQKLKFCSIDELIKLKVPPADVELVDFLRDFLGEKNKKNTTQ